MTSLYEDDLINAIADLDIVSASGRIAMMESECPKNADNARLIAAAPDLLAALEFIRDHLQINLDDNTAPDDQCLIDSANEVIKKAKS